MLRKIGILVSSAALAFGGSTAACATKQVVSTSVGEVNDRVDSLGSAVEETHERTRRNELRIADVDQKTQSAAQMAQQANDAAAAAKRTAVETKNAARVVGDKIDTMDKANRRLVYEVVLSEVGGTFQFNQTKLPNEAKQKIDALVQQLKQDPKNVYIEIEGHTDDVGPTEVNERIGFERAQAVQRYLYEKYQIPLHKMNFISYGEEKPLAPNKTKNGRAQNRRVVIKVLE